MITYIAVMGLSWVVFLLVWAIAAFNTKKDMSGGGFAGVWLRFWWLRLLAAALLLFIFVRMVLGGGHYVLPGPAFTQTLYTVPLALGWLGAACNVLGIGFAIWARVHLGRNWSALPARKEDHKLVTSGPYAYVRHPIYTGILLAALGTLATGTIFSLIVVAVASTIYLTRVGREERIMLELFPEEYPAYQKRTKRLIPFVW